MRYSLYINQDMAIKLGITNINLAHVFDLLTSVSTWAETEIIDGEVYYWVARQKISKELSILSLKSDTIYRHLKKLNELGLLDYIKVGKKDCIRITKLGKKYLSKDYVGNESEKDSDLNPTYNTTKSNPNTNDTKKQTKKETSFDTFLKTIESLFEANKILTHSSKINSTDKTKKFYKFIAVDDLLTVANDYTRYVTRNKGKAVRLDKYLLARYEGNLDAIEYGVDKPREKSSLDLKDKDYGTETVSDF